MLIKEINKSKIVFFLLFLITLVLSMLLLNSINLSNNIQASLKSEIKDNTLLKKSLEEFQQSYRFPKPILSKLDSESESSLPIFLTKVYPTLPDFQNVVPKQNISRVFFMSSVTNGVNSAKDNAWLVEEKKTDKFSDKLENPSYTYYFVNSKMQKVLSEAMSSQLDSHGKGCILEDYNVIRNFDRDSAYIVLSCTCWNVGGGGSISAYKINSGEKMILKESFFNNGIGHRNISATGNILGIINGLYGMNNPILFVESDYKEGRLTEISAYDVQKGSLIQTFNFN